MAALQAELAARLADILSADETALFESLTVEFGGGEILLGTDGPEPWNKEKGPL